MGAKNKVESCERFDWWRSWEATQAWIAEYGAEKSPQYLYVNRNKQDITLDLENPRGRELLLQLVAKADALVENYSGGVLPKLKLDYSYLVEANPDLVMVSMPAFGSTGPWSQFRQSKIEHSSGAAGRRPRASTDDAVWPSATVGLNGTAAILALWHSGGGEGQFVDLSQVECLFLSQHQVSCISQCTGNHRGDLAISTRSRACGVYPCAGDDVGGYSGR